MKINRPILIGILIIASVFTISYLMYIGTKSNKPTMNEVELTRVKEVCQCWQGEYTHLYSDWVAGKIPQQSQPTHYFTNAKDICGDINNLPDDTDELLKYKHIAECWQDKLIDAVYYYIPNGYQLQDPNHIMNEVCGNCYE